MSTRASLRAVLLVPLVVLACKGDPPAPPPPPALTAPPAPSAVDHVEPDEVPEGTEKAFGLPIPRAMRVDVRFADAVRARGDLPYGVLAGYVRQRVIAARVEAAPEKTVFSGATLKTSPEKTLRVEVVRYPDRTELVVRDMTRPPESRAVSPTDPWYQPGFDPRDRKADPKRFE